MEAVINYSGLGLWWSRLGKWQVLMAATILATFFFTLCIALCFTGDKEKVVLVAALVTALVATFVVMAVNVVAPTAFAVVAYVSVFGAVAVAKTIVTDVTTIAVAAAAAFFAVAFFVGDFFIAVTAKVKKMKEQRISKEVIRLSYMAEFAIILLSILLMSTTIRYWW